MLHTYKLCNCVYSMVCHHGIVQTCVLHSCKLLLNVNVNKNNVLVTVCACLFVNI